MLVCRLSRKLTGILLLALIILLSILQFARPSYDNGRPRSRTITVKETAATGFDNGLNSDRSITDNGDDDQLRLGSSVQQASQQDDDDRGSSDFGNAPEDEILDNDDSGDEKSVDEGFSPRHFDYREIFSLTTADRKFIPIYLAGFPGYNANLIPHPTKADFWIIVVQHEESGKMKASEELTCTAGILEGVFVCTDNPTVMPITTTTAGTCEGDLIAIAGRVWGPRDARMFYGPDTPYVTYGAQSGYICFGQWLQDARMLLDEFAIHRYMQTPLFANGVELRRPSDYGPVEKNYFLFWDSEGRPYVHYNLWPIRSFAQLNFDGNGLSDLAPVSAYPDQVCMAKFMPSVVSDWEAIHQATNSLSITLCRRADLTCVPNDSNTFIMHIFHLKSYYYFHGVYEPFVVLFQRSAPFAIHAISQRPLWIHGRENLTAASDSTRYREMPDEIPPGHTEMFYITSMSWKSHSQKYHGYIDDPLFLAFGIEDARPGVMDVLAGDLVQDLAFC